VLARHVEPDAVLVPPALHGDAVVAGDDVAVLDLDMRGRICTGDETSHGTQNQKQMLLTSQGHQRSIAES
jgi:hypothetical protein